RHFLGHVKAGVSRVAHADVLTAEVEELPAVGVQEGNFVVADGQADVNELALLVGLDVIIPLDLLAIDLDSTLHAGAPVLKGDFAREPTGLGKNWSPDDQAAQGYEQPEQAASPHPSQRLRCSQASFIPPSHKPSSFVRCSHSN